MFEYSKNINLAKLLLPAIRNKNTTVYYNILANCSLPDNIEDALNYYDNAYSLAMYDKERVKILNNKAKAIFDKCYEKLYNEALSYCKKAMSMISDNRFPYPRNYLYLLTINKTPINLLITAVENLDKDFPILKTRLKKLISMIQENDKKIALQNHFFINHKKDV